MATGLLWHTMASMPFESLSSLPASNGQANARRTERHQLLWLTAGVVLASGGALLAALVYLHAQALQAGERLGESFAHVIEEQSSRTFQSVDQRLQLATLSLAELKARGDLDAKSGKAVLEEQIKNYPYIQALQVLDAQGRIEYDSGEGTLGKDLSDQTYFKVNRDQPPSDLFIGAPQRSLNTGTWIVKAARPLPQANGNFAGVIVASLELSYFDTLWRRAELGPGAFISLLGRDGTLFMRSPLQTSLLGKSYADTPLFSRLLPSAPSGIFTGASPVDGVARLFAYRGLSKPPGMVVLVGQDKTTVLGTWTTLAWVSVSVWVTASGAIVLLSFLLSRSGRQRLRAEEGQTRMFDRITDAFLALDRQWVCVYANQHATETLGCDRSALIGKPIWHHFSADSQSLIRNACERSMADQAPSRLEEYYPPLGRWLESRLYPSQQGLTIYFQDVSARKQGEQTLQQLSRRVLEAQETERRRVARELHDELGQSLTAIKINLQTQTLFRQQPASELDTENIRIVEDAIQQVRRLALALRPSILDDLGLVPALRWMVGQSAVRKAIAVDFEATLEDVRFQPEVETAFFRIAQEALTNIARYANAQRIGVRLQRDGANLTMRIEDDGQGFDVAEMRQRALSGASMGVLGMQERAMLVGGSLDIRSSPGQGCTITLSCPWQLLQDLQ